MPDDDGIPPNESTNDSSVVPYTNVTHLAGPVEEVANNNPLPIDSVALFPQETFEDMENVLEREEYERMCMEHDKRLTTVL